MRKTNSKEVKKYFDEYLNDILTDNFDGNIDLMAKQFVASCCDGEGKLYRKYNCYQEAFKQMVWDYATPYYQDMKTCFQFLYYCIYQLLFLSVPMLP